MPATQPAEPAGVLGWLCAGLRSRGVLSDRGDTELVHRWRVELCRRLGQRVDAILGPHGAVALLHAQAAGHNALHQWLNHYLPSRAALAREEAAAMLHEASTPDLCTLRNLTGHPVTIHTPRGTVHIEPSGTIARCAEDVTHQAAPVVLLVDDKPVVLFDDITVTTVSGLPPAQDGVLLIVSRLVARAASHRRDLVFPHTPTRDGTGRTNGCRALARVRHTPRQPAL